MNAFPGLQQFNKGRAASFECNGFYVNISLTLAMCRCK